jgi:hypothetical protein
MTTSKDENCNPTLQYWDTDPSLETSSLPLPEGGKHHLPPPVHKGTINLRDIVFVDFSPKMNSPRGSDVSLKVVQDRVGMHLDTEIVLKITQIDGRRSASTFLFFE